MSGFLVGTISPQAGANDSLLTHPTPAFPSSASPGSSINTATLGVPTTGLASRIATEKQFMARAQTGGVPTRYFYPPDLAYGAHLQNGVVTPLYSAAPAPMGIGDFGLVNTTGTMTGTVLNTSSVEGSLALNSLSTFYLLDDGPQSVSFQLNTVAVNVTVQANSSDQFWTQDVPFYSARTHLLEMVDNVWNFSSYGAGLPPTTLTGSSPNDPHGVGGQFYYDFISIGKVTMPFSLQLYTNVTVSNPTVSPYKHYSSTVTFGVNVLKNGTSVHSATFDTIYFNSTATAPPAVPPVYQINGQKCSGYSTSGFCLALDAELTLGGPGGGSTAVVNGINGTMGISTWDSTLLRYVPAHSAFDYGTDTGETAVGVSESYTQAGTVELSPGPSFLAPLWNASGKVSDAGSMKLSVTISPANAFVFLETGLRNKAQFVPADGVWAPLGVGGVANYTLIPGNYTATALLSDYNPDLMNFTSGVSGISMSLVANSAAGIYTPLFAQGNSELAAISASGNGSVGSPYSLFRAPGSSIDPEFNELNDYGFPVFPGILLRDVHAHAEIQGSSTFSMTYVSPWSTIESFEQGPATNQLPVEAYNDTNLSLWGASNLSGWFAPSLLGFPTGNVILWNTTASLIGNSTFANDGSTSSVLVYNPSSGAGGNYVWGNTFGTNSTPGSSPGPSIDLSSSGNTVYNNDFTALPTAVTPTTDTYTSTVVSYADKWNVTNQSSTAFQHVNGFNLTGNILGMTWQGGNYWANYYCTLRHLPYNNTGAITKGGDYLPLGCVTPPGLVFSSLSVSPNPATAGKIFTVTAVVTGGVAPLTYSFSGIPGTCTLITVSSRNCTSNTTGVFTINANVSDSAGQWANGTVNLQILPGVTLASASITPSPATVTALGSINLTANPVCTPSPCPASGMIYSWTLNNSLATPNATTTPSVDLTAGSLPGIVSVRVNMTYYSQTVSATANVTIVSVLSIPSYTGQPSPVDVGGTTYLNVTTMGGVLPYTYFYSGLPPGCVTSSVPSLACSPSLTGQYNTTVTVTDAQGKTISASSIVVVNPAISTGLTISPGTILLGATAYVNASANGGTLPLSYSYTGLPPGCSSSNLAHLTCTPTSNGTFYVNVYVTDAHGGNGSTSNVLVVEGPLTLGAFTATPATVALGQTTALVASVQGGIPPYSFFYTGLPSGCASANTANLSCTASVPGRFTIDVSITDTAGAQLTGVALLTVIAPSGFPVITSFSAYLSTIDLGNATTFTTLVTGGTGTLSYAYTNMPPGCSAANTNSFNCIPSLSGNYTPMVAVTDAAGHMSEATTLLTVLPFGPAFSLVSVSISPHVGSVSVNTRAQFTAQPVCTPSPCPTYGVAYTWSVSNSLGVVSPTNTPVTTLATGSSTGTITLSLLAATHTTAVSSALTLAILATTSSGVPKITSFGATPSIVSLGSTVQFNTVTRGGTYPLSYHYTGLPPGCLSQNASIFSCTPGIGGLFNVWVVVTDATGKSASASTNLTVIAPSGYPLISSFTVSPQQVSVGSSAVFTVTASGGTPPLSYSYTGLPSGCQSASTSSLSCTPSQAGNYSVQVTVTDAAGRSVAGTTHLIVVSSGGASNSSSSSELLLLILVAVAVVAVLAILVIWAVRRHERRGRGAHPYYAPPSPPPSGPAPPPPPPA